jgi:hypothetical protein
VGSVVFVWFVVRLIKSILKLFLGGEVWAFSSLIACLLVLSQNSATPKLVFLPNI